MNQSTITLDAREDIRNGREPLAKIIAAISHLEPGQGLLLIAPFEPVPLIFLLAKQNFTHKTKTNAAGDWEILFTRNGRQPLPFESPPTPCGCGCSETPKSDIIQMDARGLEPPQPMVKILEILTSLPPDAQLRAQTDRRPVHLYPMLTERGFTAQTEEQTDGSFITNIRRN